MKLNKRNMMIMGLLTAMLTGTLSGCGEQKSTVATDAKESSTSTETKTESKDKEDVKEEPEKLEGSLLSKEPKTFSVFLINSGSNKVFDPEWPVWKEIAKRTNIQLESIVPKSTSNKEEAFNLMLTSGELADIVAYSTSNELEQLGRNGGLIPLNDLIDEYAPNIKKVMDENPSFKQAAYSLDGNIYQVPRLQEIFSAEYWWIRQDWLDKLKLETPKTVDDLYKVLTAFRNEDPNGNGKKDEVPLFDRAGWKMPDEFLYLWDTSTGFYAKDKKIIFEPLEENFKLGVQNVAKWYKEGLIDPEIFTRGPKSRDILLSGNLGGMTHDWVSAGGYDEKLKDTIPGFHFVGMAPPANQNGEILERTCRYPNTGWGISSQCEDPVTVMKFFDYLFSDEGTSLVNYGIEGDTYTKESDGTIKYTDKVMKSEGGAHDYLVSIGLNSDIARIEPAAYEYAFMTESGKEVTKLYNDHPEWFLKDLPPYRDGKLNLKYLPEDEDEYKKIMANIESYVDERFQSWMMGASNIDDDYDAFVAELKKRNIDRAIEINQKAYDIYIGK